MSIKWVKEFKPGTTTRNIHEAANKAFETLDLIRGIWNLYIIQQTPWRLSWRVTQEPGYRNLFISIEVLC